MVNTIVATFPYFSMTIGGMYKTGVYIGGILFLLFPLAIYAQFGNPNINGTITGGEYGNHTNGQNQEYHNNDGQTWYMTWDNSNLYIAVDNADVNEAAIVYIDADPILPINGGTNSNGNLSGFNYDGTDFAELQFRADFVAYFKSGYNEYRTANGSGTWSAATAAFATYAEDGSSVREVAISWASITGSGRPVSFNWFGYLASGSGNGYGAMPEANHNSGSIGTSARWSRYYTVDSTNDGSSAPPFSQDCYVFNSTTDIANFGAIDIFDFTMNDNGLSITRGSGDWNIAGRLHIEEGTVDFGSTTSNCDVNGDVTIGTNSGFLTLSSAVGGDITIGGDFTVNGSGSFNCNNRAVYFDGNSGKTAQTVGGSATFTIDYFKHENSNDITISTLVTIDNDIDLNSNGNGGKVIVDAIALIIAENASISNADAAHYFVTEGGQGIQKYNLAGLYTFPVGTANSYNKVVLSNNESQPYNYTVLVCDGVRDNGGCSGGTLITSQAVDKTWSITTNSPDSDIELYWNSFNELSGFNRNSSAINEYGTGNWTAITAFDAALGMGPYFQEVTGYSISFVGTFGISSGGLLPLRFTSFHATAHEKNTVNLHWKIADVVNVSHFEIEHSADGNYFQPISTKSLVSTTTEYQYQHSYPAQGDNYYRIKSVDYDGKSQYSEARHVLLSDIQQPKASIDNSGQLHLWLPETTVLPASLQVYDVMGRKILDRQVDQRKVIMKVTAREALLLVNINGNAFWVN